MKLAVITGCDSGIGEALSMAFAEKEYTLLISYLRSNPLQGRENIHAMKLDLNSERQIRSFASRVKKMCGQGYSLDYFINNAGIAMGGPFENIPLDIYRRVFEVNYFGLLSVTQKIIPDLIKSRGRLVVIGSMAGRISLPFFSPYSSSKYALEGFCDSVRRELNPFGVKTILIEPGGIATPIWNSVLRQDLSFMDDKYRQCAEKVLGDFIESGNRGMAPERAAEQIIRFITKKSPAARYIIADNRLKSFLELLVPDRLMDRILARVFSMNYGNGSRQTNNSGMTGHKESAP